MSISFDGLADGVRMADGLSITNGWAVVSITGWIKRAGDTVGDNEQVIFFEQNSGVNTRLETQIADTSNLLQQMARAPDSGATQSGLSATTIPVDATGYAPNIHFASVLDIAADTIAIYLNGVLSLSTSVAFTNLAFDATVTGNDNSVGCQTSGGVGTQFWNGQISDIRVYNRKLSTDEILTMYRMRGHDGLRGARRELAGRYTLSDIAGGNLATTANLRDSSAANLFGPPQVILGAPNFGDDFLAYRRVVC